MTCTHKNHLSIESDEHPNVAQQLEGEEDWWLYKWCEDCGALSMFKDGVFKWREPKVKS